MKISLNLEDARLDPGKFLDVEAFFRDLEFNSLIVRLRTLGQQTPEGAAIPGKAAGEQQLSLFGEAITQVGIVPTYELETVVVNSTPTLDELVSRLSEASVIGFDTETTSTNQMQSKLVGISLAVREGQGYYIPVGHTTGEAQLPLVQVISALRPALTDPSKPKVGQNLKFDRLVLERNKLKAAPLGFDSMLAEWLINPASHSLGLKEMAGRYLNASMTHIEELIGRGKGQITMAEVPVALAAPYAAADAEVVLRLMPILQKEMDKVGATKLFQRNRNAADRRPG